jgi:hypothetical protein
MTAGPDFFAETPVGIGVVNNSPTLGYCAFSRPFIGGLDLEVRTSVGALVNTSSSAE